MTTPNTYKHGYPPIKYQYPAVIVSENDPTSSDVFHPTAGGYYPISTLWVNKTNDGAWILTSISGYTANWEAFSDPASGNVDGPASSTDNAIARFDGTTGKLIQNGVGIISDAGAVTGLTNITLPLITGLAASDFNLKSASGQDVLVDMGDDAGANNVSFRNLSESLLVRIDSDGQVNLLAGNLIQTRSDAAAEVLIDVTNSDNTSADSDAFFEAAVGGTASGNPGIRFQISGGQNYSAGIDNASAADDFLICGDNDIGTDPLLRIQEAGDVLTEKGNLIINTAGKQLQVHGGAVTDFIGTATLTAGTVTIANTNIAATDRIFIQRQDVNSSTAIGNLTYSISAATSFTITSVQDAAPGVTETNDVSIVSYFIVRQAA